MMLNMGSSAAFVTLGVGADCDHTGLFAAYLDNDPFVRVTSQAVYSEVFTISKTKWFTGGYDNCTDARNNVHGLNKSSWTDNINSNSTVVSINSNAATVAIVVIENFDIFGGEDINPGGVGGIKATGNVSVVLNNSAVRNSLGQSGGGLFVSGSQAQVTLNNSVISNNTSRSNGGGIFCDQQATVNILGSSSIYRNIAQGNGGGVFANNGCQINNESGDTDSITAMSAGIVRNSAYRGGGVYLSLGSGMSLSGNELHPASILGNYAQDGGPSNAIGGGIFLTDEMTSLTAINARIERNESGYFGGGIFITNNAIANIGRLDASCWDNAKCSSLSSNFSNINGVGGLGYVSNSATLNISQSLIANNIGSNSALFLLASGARLKLEGNLITGNSGIAQPANHLFNTSSVVGGSTIDFLYNTLSDNSMFSIFNLNTDSMDSIQTLNVNNSIVYEAIDIISITGGFNPNVNVDCVFVNEINSLVGNINNTSTDNPLFVDPINGDYSLSESSTAIDYCDEFLVQSQSPDLNGNARGFDVQLINDNLGPYDAGAYEYSSQIIRESIFKSGFEQ